MCTIAHFFSISISSLKSSSEHCAYHNYCHENLNERLESLSHQTQYFLSTDKNLKLNKDVNQYPKWRNRKLTTLRSTFINFWHLFYLFFAFLDEYCLFRVHSFKNEQELVPQLNLMSFFFQFFPYLGPEANDQVFMFSKLNLKSQEQTRRNLNPKNKAERQGVKLFDKVHLVTNYNNEFPLHLWFAQVQNGSTDGSRIPQATDAPKRLSERSATIKSLAKQFKTFALSNHQASLVCKRLFFWI